MAFYKLSLFRTGKAQCFVARDPRGAIVVKRAVLPQGLQRSFLAL